MCDFFLFCLSSSDSFAFNKSIFQKSLPLLSFHTCQNPGQWRTCLQQGKRDDCKVTTHLQTLYQMFMANTRPNLITSCILLLLFHPVLLAAFSFFLSFILHVPLVSFYLVSASSVRCLPWCDTECFSLVRYLLCCLPSLFLSVFLLLLFLTALLSFCVLLFIN